MDDTPDAEHPRGKLPESGHGRHPPSRDELRQIALARFAPMRDGAPPEPLDKLADRFGRNTSSISRAIGRAFREGLVQIQAIGALPVHRRLEDEAALLERFRTLHAARVVDARQAEGAKSHVLLGQAAARYIASGAVLRDNDVIALASGRAVYHAVSSLRDDGANKLRHAPIRIISLSGNIGHESGAPTLLDADYNCALLGSCFETEAVIRPVSYPLVHSSSKECSDSVLDTEFTPDTWNRNKPTIAVLGVGALDEHHRLYLAANDSDSWLARTSLKDGRDLIKALVNMSWEVRQVVAEAHPSLEEVYRPIGDVFNYLFYVPPPSGIEIGDREFVIKKAINDLNSLTLRATPSQVAQADAVFLIAGGASKAAATRCIIEDGLGRDNLNVRWLCVDSLVAMGIERLVRH